MNKSIEVLVTGSNGQLGSELQTLAKNLPNINFDFRTRDTLDITDPEKVIETINGHKYDFVINCAAYTAVDKAESDEQNCFELNAYAPMLLAMLCGEKGTRLIHVSSDYVYHQDLDRPMTETDECSPKGVYAISKLEGEENIIGASDQHIIIRTSWLYSNYGNNFVKTMLRLGNTKKELSVVNDQIGAPTFAADLAQAIIKIITYSANNTTMELGGVYNYCNKGVTSWYGFAKEIFRLKNIDISLSPIPSTDYPTAAERPPWSVLNTSKIEETFDLKLRSWQIAIAEMLSKENG